MGERKLLIYVRDAVVAIFDFFMRKIGESRNNNPWDRRWGETKWRVIDRGEKNI